MFNLLTAGTTPAEMAEPPECTEPLSSALSLLSPFLAKVYAQTGTEGLRCREQNREQRTDRPAFLFSLVLFPLSQAC